MRKLYAVSRTVYRSIGQGTFVPEVKHHITSGHSAQRVQRKQREAALNMFPKHEGWRGHHIIAKRMDKHVSLPFGYPFQP